MRRISGAEAIAETMKLYQVEYFFGMPGSTEPIYDAIHRSAPEIVPILTRDERSGAHMADGYSRIRYKPGVCTACQGPGATNLATGIAEAYMSSTPVIAITSARPTTQIGKNAYQEIDHFSVLTPITKLSVRVSRAYRVAEMIRRAFRIATSGRPGPVLVDVNQDAIDGKADVEIYVEEDFAKYPALRVGSNTKEIREAAELLAKAERPVIVAGGGVIISRAWNELIELADLMCVPVATTLSGKGSIPENHPLAVGVVGSYTRRSANKVVGEADLVLYIGCKTGALSTDFWTLPQPGTDIIHIDIDHREISRNYPTKVGIVADARMALEDLIKILKVMTKKPIKKDYRFKSINKAIKEWKEHVSPLKISEEIPIRPQRLLKEIRSVLQKNDILVADTGYSSAWSGAYYDVLARRRGYINASGTLGASFPLAIGVKLGVRANAHVICFTGDGGFAYNIAELETALRCGASLVTVIMNNQCFGFERQFMKHYGLKCDEAWKLLDTDFSKIAKDFGCFGLRVERPGEIREALVRAFNSGKPAVVDVLTAALEVDPPVTFYDNFVIGY